MKFVVLASVTWIADARLLAAELSFLSNKKALKRQTSLAVSASAEQRRFHYGDTNCPCIGFDNLKGETVVEVDVTGDEKVSVAYPADMGARCEAWDNGRYPGCREGELPGFGKGYCEQQWCYVDPCKCDIDAMPKISEITPDATYRGLPLFWSYETCGGSDMFEKKIPPVGRPGCRCIGFAGVSGTTEITFKDGKVVKFAADMGSTCQTWDKEVHPECTGSNMPTWCRASWCYVDPCECDLGDHDIFPKISAYLPEATFTGKNLYYSYETCGSPDLWTEHGNPEACINQKTEARCGGNPRCAWTGSRCLGSELVNHPLCEAVHTSKFHSHSGAHSTGLLASVAIGLAVMTSSRAVLLPAAAA